MRSYGYVDTPVCRCGHSKEAHTHLRRGSDCAVCDCRRFLLPGSIDPEILGVWLGMLLASVTVLALIVTGAVKLLQWLF